VTVNVGHNTKSKGEIQNILPPIPKKSQKSFEWGSIHAQTFAVCPVVTEAIFVTSLTSEIQKYASIYFHSPRRVEFVGPDKSAKIAAVKCIQWLGWSLRIIYGPPDFFSQSPFFHIKVHETFALISIGNQPWNRVLPL
jgi:hypothetical protein